MRCHASLGDEFEASRFARDASAPLSLEQSGSAAPHQKAHVEGPQRHCETCATYMNEKGRTRRQTSSMFHKKNKGMKKRK